MGQPLGKFLEQKECWEEEKCSLGSLESDVEEAIGKFINEVNKPQGSV